MTTIPVQMTMNLESEWVDPKPATYDSENELWSMSGEVKVPRGHIVSLGNVKLVVKRMEVEAVVGSVTNEAMQSLLGAHYQRQRDAVDNGDVLQPGSELGVAIITAIVGSYPRLENNK